MTHSIRHTCFLSFGLAALLAGCTPQSSTEGQPAPVAAAPSGNAAGTAKPDPAQADKTVKEESTTDSSETEGVGAATPSSPTGNTGVIGDEAPSTETDAPPASNPTPPTGATGVINADRPADANSDGPGRGSAYKTAPAGYGPDMVTQWAKAHEAAKGQGFKYVYVPPALANIADSANIMRVAAGKAWNHLSWQTEIDVPEDISDGHGLAFALNAPKVWGAEAETNWGYIANCTPKANIDISPAPRGDCATFTGAIVEIPRFVYNAVQGGPYANIHKTPPNYSSFANKFNLGPIQAVSTHKEAIVCGPRITAYRSLTVNGVQLVYSFSSDEFNGRDNGNINYTNAPTDADQRSTGAFNAAPGDGNTAIASEWWMQLPNGFIYFGIHGEGSQERGKAEFPFAVDPANWKQGADLTTGRSCITCHTAGIQSAPSDQEYAGRNGWTSNEQLGQLYANVRGKYQESLKKLVDALSDGEPSFNTRLVDGTIEPVSMAILAIEGPFQGNNGACESFCNGKFGAARENRCSTMPKR